VPTLVIVYDLLATTRPSADRARLVKRINGYREWAQVTGSAWVVATDEGPEEVRDALLAEIDDGGRLFVAALDRGAAWHNVICPSSWLKDHVQPSRREGNGREP
jgi:hypothetical protein